MDANNDLLMRASENALTPEKALTVRERMGWGEQESGRTGQSTMD